MSKDLFEDEPNFRESIEPHARELNEIRNHGEHKYLKLHGDEWTGQGANSEPPTVVTDTLAFSLYRRDFEIMALDVVGLARTALIYLSLAIHCEEKRRASQDTDSRMKMPMPLDIWEDEWKE